MLWAMQRDETALTQGANDPGSGPGGQRFVWPRGSARLWTGSRRSVRLRLTLTYGLLFLVCGVALLAITYLLVQGASFGPPRGYNPPAVSGNTPIGIAVERRTVLHELLLRSGIALAVMAVVSLWLGWVVAGRVLAPLRVITARTHEISEASLHRRLALDGPEDELKELGDTIDGLLERLERAFELQRRFVSNVSHELRTPLAMMRTSLDVAAGKPSPMSEDAAVLAGKVREGLDQADRLVESFLVLARAEAGAAELEVVSLSGLASTELRDRQQLIAGHRLETDARLAPAQVQGSRVLLTRLLANLLDNAIRYSHPGGKLTISTEADGPMIRLTIENDGEMIDPAETGRLLEPFHRLGAERTGSLDGVGLGLSIVAAIAAAHQGAFELHARPHGGMTAIVEIPRVPAGQRDGALG
jgi:signal transduction histidine kinase